MNFQQVLPGKRIYYRMETDPEGKCPLSRVEAKVLSYVVYLRAKTDWKEKYKVTIQKIVVNVGQKRETVEGAIARLIENNTITLPEYEPNHAQLRQWFQPKTEGTIPYITTPVVLRAKGSKLTVTACDAWSFLAQSHLTKFKPKWSLAYLMKRLDIDHDNRHTIVAALELLAEHDLIAYSKPFRSPLVRLKFLPEQLSLFADKVSYRGDDDTDTEEVGVLGEMPTEETLPKDDSLNGDGNDKALQTIDKAEILLENGFAENELSRICHIREVDEIKTKEELERWIKNYKQDYNAV